MWDIYAENPSNDSKETCDFNKALCIIAYCIAPLAIPRLNH